MHFGHLLVSEETLFQFINRGEINSTSRNFFKTFFGKSFQIGSGTLVRRMFYNTLSLRTKVAVPVWSFCREKIFLWFCFGRTNEWTSERRVRTEKSWINFFAKLFNAVWICWKIIGLKSEVIFVYNASIFEMLKFSIHVYNFLWIKKKKKMNPWHNYVCFKI